ncbi:MAG: hypothetical protein ACK52J_04805 [bacterium]
MYPYLYLITSLPVIPWHITLVCLFTQTCGFVAVAKNFLNVFDNMKI